MKSDEFFAIVNEKEEFLCQDKANSRYFSSEDIHRICFYRSLKYAEEMKYNKCEIRCYKINLTRIK
jgi:hypothetical protein